MTRAVRYAGRALAVVVGLVVLGALWEGYKAWGPERGAKVLGVPLLPRTDDTAMPHLSAIWKVFGDDDGGGAQKAITFGPKQDSPSVLHGILVACGHTLVWAAVGFAIGVVVGVLLSLVMERFGLAERALLPYVVLSQTVPLIALTPVLQQWGHHVHVGPWDWTNATSIELIAAYLAFFPVSVGMLRGLKSPSAVHADYFASAAAGWWSTLLRLKLPAAVRYLVPSLRLAAAASVVGAIVAEISLGQGSVGQATGIGSRIWQYTQQSEAARLYASVAAAAALGLVAAAAITLVDLALWRYHRTGARA
ncbi:ABC transporter permease [Nocardioides cheoyonin]|uniref:ABC transporter permease n=1 Tax=Nocardioides cheoyonin TaxID=3156615 RepID=UPI0032B4F1EB